MSTTTEPHVQPRREHTAGDRAGKLLLPTLAVPALVLFLVLNAGTALTPLGSAAVASVLVSVGWWMAAHRTAPRALLITSCTALVLTVGAAALDRMAWTWVPWLVVALTCAAAAVYRQRRGGRSRRPVRVAGRGVLGATVLVAMASLLFDPTPDLPAPTGEFAVGSETYTWTDPNRAETATADTADRREVIAQVWYPTDEEKGTAVKYVGVDRKTQLAGGYPTWVSSRYDDVDTHATHDVVSVARRTWPVLVFSPGASLARQTCTALCAELASRGYVVVALSHPYDSSASRLSDGRVVNPDPSHMDTPAENAHLVDIRVADTEFVLDRLQTLQRTPTDASAPSGSVLAGHLDLGRIAMIGHSLGGATAERVLAEDDRLDAAVNIDGRIFDPAPTLDRPYLWLQNEATADATTGADHPTGDLADMARLERQLLARQTGPGGLLVVDGTRHLDFTDIPAYLSPLGRRLLGSYTLTSPAGVDEMTALTADLVEEFLGDLSNPGAVSVEELAATHAGVTPYAGQ
jgi:predicted dienelactone hydrolase